MIVPRLHMIWAGMLAYLYIWLRSPLYLAAFPAYRYVSCLRWPIRAGDIALRQFEDCHT